MHVTTRRGVPILLAALATLAACEVQTFSNRKADKQDTTTAPARVGAALPAESAAAVGPPGVPAVPTDSLRAAGAAGAGDTGVVRIAPERPRRGGVIFALAQGLTTQTPRCTWKGASLPCYQTDGGVLAIVPLPADEPAGTFTLTIDRPAGRIRRDVVVADSAFERELVFLDRRTYAKVADGAEVARDARTLRRVLTGEAPERLWSGVWRAPLAGAATGYGVERFYLRASDSSRAVALTSAMRTRGAFGADTTVAGGSDAPSWRHAGVDIAGRRGAPVVAPAAGLVAEVGSYVLTGTTVVLDHGQGVHTTYFHLDSALVRRGDRVEAGRTIGRVGSTGLSTGPHLHYGVYVHGRDVDPAAWREMPDFVRRAPGDTAAVRDTARAAHQPSTRPAPSSP